MRKGSLRASLLGYLVAALSVAVAVWLRLQVDPIVGDRFPYSLIFLAVLSTAWFGGLLPALFAAIAGGFAAVYFFVEPRGRFEVWGWNNQVGLTLFVITGTGIALLGGRMQAARRRAEAEAAQLDARVQERTAELEKSNVALQASERLLQTVFDTIPHALLVKDAAGHYLMVNQTWCTRYGVAAGDAIGKRVSELFTRPVPDWKRADDEDRAVLEGGGAISFSGSDTLPDGSVRQFQSIKAPLRDEAGRVAGLVGIVVDVTDMKHAEDELRKNQRLLATVFDTLPMHLVVKDKDTRHLMVNRAWSERYGLSREQVIGKRTLDIPGRREEDKQKSYQDDQQTLASEGTPLVLEGWDRTATGEIRHYQSHRAPIRDEHGQVTGLVGATVDLTDLKNAEAKLRANERLLQTVFDTIPHLVIVKDRDGRYQMVNKAWSQVYGLTSQQVVGKLSGEVMGLPAPELARITQTDHEVMTQGATVAGEQQYTAPNGDRRIYTFFKSPFHDEQGRAAGLVAVLVDVTAEKAAQRQADLAHTRLSDAMESLPAAIFLYGPDEKLVLWNSRVQEWFPELYAWLKPGVTYEEVLRHAARLLVVSQEGMDTYIQERLRAFRNQPSAFEQPLSDGRWLQAIERRTSDGGTLSLRLDITPLKKQHEQLRQAQKMEALGQLTGGVAHDFNNILAIIMTYSEMVRDQLQAGTPVHADAQEILDAAERAAALTRQLLAFGRRQVLKMEPAQLNEIVAGMHNMLRRVVPENVELRLHLAPSLPLVTADRTQIEQVVMNLAVNARDAMPEGGMLTIETADRMLGEEEAREHGAMHTGPHVMLVVSDSGTGMDEATQARIFEPFFTTKALGKGTGLGLATVHGIVNQMGGTVWLYSELGRGTTFKIFFPVLAETPVAAPDARKEPEMAKTGSETILLVEDDDNVRTAARRILAGAGYTVHQARNGKEAVEVLAGNDGAIDCILSDFIMPGMSAKELLDAVRTRTSAPLIFMSGYTDTSIANQGVLDGDQPFLQKPFTKASLLAKVREALNAAGSGASSKDTN